MKLWQQGECARGGRLGRQGRLQRAAQVRRQSHGQQEPQRQKGQRPSKEAAPSRRRRLMLLCALAVLIFVALPWARVPVAQAEDGLGSVTNLPVPRYVSLRSDRINVRRGPGLDYRKDWVFRRAGLPVKIIDEYGDWRRIVDMDQAGGWVYHAMLTGRRTVVVVAHEAVLRTEPDDAAAPRARAEQGVVARLHSCGPEWCRIESGGYRGWVEKSDIWGVEPGEIIGD